MTYLEDKTVNCRRSLNLTHSLPHQQASQYTIITLEQFRKYNITTPLNHKGSERWNNQSAITLKIVVYNAYQHNFLFNPISTHKGTNFFVKNKKKAFGQ
jgi:hypothetical protein